MKKNKKKKVQSKRKPMHDVIAGDKLSVSLQEVGGVLQKGEAIYRRNVQALRRRYPELAREAEKTELAGRRILSAASGAANLYMIQEDVYYYDQADPLKDTEEQLKALKLKNTRLAVILGLGLGYQALYFADKMAQEQQTSYILIVEKEMEIFKAALRATDLVPLLENEKVSFMVGLPEEGFYVEMRSYLAENARFMLLKAMKPVYHASALQLHKGYYLQALKQLREGGVHQVTNFGNDPHDSLIGVENMLANLPEIVYHPGVNLLYEKFKGKPAVIVSTGPSLNKNKHLLKGLENKALIIAPEASLKVLLAIDVKPHMITSLERVMAVLKLVEGLDEEDVKDVYLAACPVIMPHVYKAYPGPRIIVYRNFDHFKWLGIERGILDIKLSAGNMAFKVAEALGCDPIILIGQDLAFARDGATHAAGATLGEKQDSYYQQGTMEVMGNDGEPILTSPTLYSFLKGYEMDLAKYKGRCINSTEGGAFIQGSSVLPFQEAIDQYLQEEYNPAEMLKEYLGSFTAAEAERDLKKVLALLERTTGDLNKMVSLCTRGLERHRDYREELVGYLRDPGQSALEKKDIERMHREVISPKNEIHLISRTFQLFLMHIIQSFDIKFEMDMLTIPEKYDDSLSAMAELTLRQVEWYETCKDIMEICLGSLAKAREDLTIPSEGIMAGLKL